MVNAADHTNQPIFSGYESPNDWPWSYHVVVMESRRISSYFELPENARPPRSIWHSPDKCNEFIKKNLMPEGRKSQSGGFLEFSDSEQEHAN